MKSIFEVIGVVAALCSMISFLPQAIKTFRNKKVKDLSLFTHVFAAAGNLFWFIYGIGIGSFQLIVCNSISCVVTGSVVVMIILYQKKRK